MGRNQRMHRSRRPGRLPMERCHRRPGDRSRYAVKLSATMKCSPLFLALLIAGCGDSAPTQTPTASNPATGSHSNTTQRAASDQPVAVEPERRPLDGDVTIDVNVTELPGRRIRLNGTTNLPTSTNLMLSVEERMQGGFRGQSKCSVASDGSFDSEAFGPHGGLKDGLYVAEVMMPIARVQPDNVKKVIGENGENLSGPLVENGSFGVTLSAKKEFTIGGAQAAQAQQQRAKDAEESITKLKSDVCVQLERLLAFKDKQDFKTYGFGKGGPYHKWLTDVEALRNSQPKGATHPVPLVLRAAPGDLIMLGMEYMQKQGETDYTRQILPELQQTIGYADYLTTKSQRGQNAP